jgi:hypothetical protein
MWPTVRGGRDDHGMAAPPIPVKPFSREHILRELKEWAECLAATADDPIARELARAEIDVWLDELSAWHSR